RLHLVRGTANVLLREAVHRHLRDADVAAKLEQADSSRDALRISGSALEASRVGPSPVSVRYEADVLRDTREFHYVSRKKALSQRRLALRPHSARSVDRLSSRGLRRSHNLPSASWMRLIR